MFFDNFLEALLNTICTNKPRFGSHLKLYNQFILLIFSLGTLILSSIALTSLWPKLTTSGLLRLLSFFIALLITTFVSYLIGLILYKLEGLDYKKLKLKKN